jgi:hypothetical protein
MVEEQKSPLLPVTERVSEALSQTSTADIVE